MRRELVEEAASLSDQPAGRRGGEHARRMGDSPTGAGDLVVGGAADTSLKIFDAVARKNQVGVGIYKTRHHDAASTVDGLRLQTPSLGGQLARLPDAENLLPLRQQRAVAEDSQFAQCRPSPRHRRASKRQQLFRAVEEKHVPGEGRHLTGRILLLEYPREFPEGS